MFTEFPVAAVTAEAEGAAWVCAAGEGLVSVFTTAATVCSEGVRWERTEMLRPELMKVMVPSKSVRWTFTSARSSRAKVSGAG